tara:strand:- start:22 stop:201 length:180 start_codon:yes stop_codon:yes gene_type:complete
LNTASVDRFAAVIGALSAESPALRNIIGINIKDLRNFYVNSLQHYSQFLGVINSIYDKI